jgi:EAL domain-containing protein (putative c-di-GMP-specific phosphodiesterase class I)
MITVDMCCQASTEKLVETFKDSNYAKRCKVLIVSSCKAKQYSDEVFDLIILIQDDTNIPSLQANNITAVDYVADDKTLRDNILKELMMCLRASYNEHHVEWYEALLPHYQPIIDIKTKRLCGYEVLARLQSGNELMMPELALHWLNPKENALVFRQLLKRTRNNLCQLDANQPLYFNIDCSTLINAEAFSILCEDLVENYENTLKFNIVLELTEDELEKTHASSKTIDINMGHLIKLGVTFAIDDFGAKSSNYDRLQRFKKYIKTVKIDKNYFWQLHKNTPKENVSAFVELIKSLRIGVVIFEGVEDVGHLNKIIRTQLMIKKIDLYAQGFYIGAPEEKPSEYKEIASRLA